MIGRTEPSTFDLRVFAALLCPFCGLIAAWIGRSSGMPRLGWWTALAIAPVSLLGLFRPLSVRGVYRTWTSVTTPIGRLISVLVLAAIYFFVITPMGWCLRLCGIDPAHRRWDSTATTYWLDRTPVQDESFFHPF